MTQIKYNILIGILLFLTTKSSAITWEFDEEENAQGWTARESIGSGGGSATLSSLYSEVYDGNFRILLPNKQLNPIPTVTLISPLLGYDSALFDRVSIRFRIISASPIEGVLGLSWTNEKNRDTPGSQPFGEEEYLFFISQKINYTTDWQEVIISDLRPKPWIFLGKQYELAWVGNLTDIRLDFILGEMPGNSAEQERIIPDAIEIDRIVLTGTEELIQGELPPPSIPSAFSSGNLFAKPRFQPLDQKGIQDTRWLGKNNMTAALGDLDGDRDIDLVTTYFDKSNNGWLSAFNNGTGVFSHPIVEKTSYTYLQGGDVNGDGLIDIFTRGVGFFDSKLLLNEGETGLNIKDEWHNMYPIGVGDGDGDGDLDFWMNEDPSQQNYLVLLKNDGTGHFGQRKIIEVDQYAPSQIVWHIDQKGKTGVLWIKSNKESGYLITYIDEEEELVKDYLPVDLGFKDTVNLHYIGDFDQDGDVDIVAGKEEIFDKVQLSKGLVFWINKGNDDFESIEWYKDVELSANIIFTDLNGDDILDPVFVDSNERNPAVMVHLGVGGGLPRWEGRYPLRGQGGAVLSGDVDGDGDVDLVVLERAVEGQGGVHVLLNRLNDQPTAVQEGRSTLPPGFHLGANYPNPFNSQTWIPFEIPADSGSVQLRIYNVLGQPIRTLVVGRLRAGRHVVPWDGRDQNGQAVSSGLYFYRLQAGAWTATGKMVKSE